MSTCISENWIGIDDFQSNIDYKMVTTVVLGQGFSRNAVLQEHTKGDKPFHSDLIDGNGIFPHLNYSTNLSVSMVEVIVTEYLFSTSGILVKIYYIKLKIVISKTLN